MADHDGTYILSLIVNDGISDSPEDTVQVISKLNKLIFVSSVQGNGDLSSWPDAGVETGIAAGDAICQARADSAGLEGTFIAWLSDESDDAYCRVHNLTGRKIDNCGQGTLPIAAGPWIRMDNFPFSDTIDQLMSPNNVIYAPVRYNEYGEAIGGAFYFTDTDIDGTLDLTYSGCDNWTSNSSNFAAGSGAVGSGADFTMWTGGLRNSCDQTWSRLLCMQTGEGEELLDFATAGKKVFLSSAEGNGDLSSWSDAVGTGLEAGDAICQARADSVGLEGTFIAWLSDSSTNAIDRLTSNGPWVRLDGVKIANDISEFNNGELFTSINLSEMNTYHIGSNVWTGTDNYGIKKNDTCNDWMDGSGSYSGVVGHSSNVERYWSEYFTPPCSYQYRLYCFED